jgi:anaerobic ribonucleoside-triphosphate reductase activating protein
LVNAAATLFPEKDIWMFTGYTLEELLHSGVETPYITDILKHVAVLVDGPFILEKKNLMLKYRGSENQRLIDVPKTLEAGKVIFWKDKYDRL